MKLRLAVVVLLLAACAQPPAPKVTPPTPTTPTPIRSNNALTPVASAARTIVEPRIRVGLLSDQTSVTFPRIDGGYYLITDSGASALRRGFTDSAPLSETVVRYAVQAGAISDKPSAEAFADAIAHRNRPARRRDLRSGRRPLSNPRRRFFRHAICAAAAQSVDRGRLRKRHDGRAPSDGSAVRTAASDRR